MRETGREQFQILDRKGGGGGGEKGGFTRGKSAWVPKGWGEERGHDKQVQETHVHDSNNRDNDEGAPVHVIRHEVAHSVVMNK